jgi:hypothetical protein
MKKDSIAIACIATFKELGIEETGSAHEHALFTGTGISGKGYIKQGIRIGKGVFGLSHGLLGRNLADSMRGCAAHIGGTLHGGWKYVKRDLAVTCITFGAAINTTAAAARRFMDNVNGLARCVADCKSRDAIVAILFNAAKLIIARCEGRHLIAAALYIRTTRRNVSCDLVSKKTIKQMTMTLTATAGWTVVGRPQRVPGRSTVRSSANKTE